MQFNRANFLTALKGIVTGGGYKKDLVTVAEDAGFLHDEYIGVSDGVLATGATFAVDAQGQPRISVAATNTGIVTFGIVVPRDYDETTDEFTVRFWALSAAGNDTPTITLTPKIGNVTANPTAITAQTTAAVGTTATLYELTFRRGNLTRNGFLTLTFTSAAHATDALLFYGIHWTYRSTLVSFSSETGRAGRGTSLR